MSNKTQSEASRILGNMSRMAGYHGTTTADVVDFMCENYSMTVFFLQWATSQHRFYPNYGKEFCIQNGGSMTAIETLISVLCDPEGKCCISGSDGDRRLIDSALAELAQAADSVQEDAARYRLLRRGRHWSVIDGIGNDLLRAEALDAAVDAVLAAQGGKT